MPNHTPEQIAKRNEDTLKHFMPFWLANTGENLQYIIKGINNNQHAHNVPLNGKDYKKGIIVIASGPSLFKQKEHLHKLNEYLIICSPTNYGLCRAWGLIPDIIVVADSSPKMPRDLFAVLAHHLNTNIVCSSNIHPSIHQFWPTERIFWFRNLIQNEQGNYKTPYNNFITLLLPGVTDYIAQAGNVTNLGLLLIELLRKFNRFGKEQEMPPAYLIGVDLCFTEEAFRSPKYGQNQDGKFEPIPLPPARKDLDTQEVLEHNGKLTNIQMFNYKRSLLMLWQGTPWKLYNCSKESLLTELPKIPIEQLIKGHKPKSYPKTAHKRAYKKFIESPLPTKGGIAYDVLNLTNVTYSCTAAAITKRTVIKEEEED